ncbi:MAG: response regulator, partial [Candidatus Latescibacteria bacterium]|nr:response regulator [Candidatus Latescibacterota bacterium]
MESRGQLLIVDSDPIALASISEMLQSEGYECDMASATETAEVRVIQGAFDLLIIDAGMPGNTDLAFISEIRKILPSIPILVLSDSPTVSCCMAVMALQAADLASKPISREELYSKVESLVVQGQISTQVRASRIRLDEWSRDLHMLEQVLDQGAHAAQTARSLVLMTMRNIVGGLIDMERIVE